MDHSMPGLTDFLAALDRRLHGLGHEGVSSALRSAAGRLSPSERPAFLAMFDPAPAAPADALLAEIEALVTGHGHAEDNFEDQRRYRRYRDDWWQQDEEPRFSGEADDLYRQLGQRFVACDWTVAAEGYRRLLYASVADVDSSDGCVVGGSHEVVQEALARFLRCLLAPASEPLEQRAVRVVEALDDLGSSLGTPSLAAILNAHPDRIEDFDPMLGALGALAEDRAKTASSWNLSQFQQLAIDVAVTLGGADGLAPLACDATMPRPDQVWERWMTELAAVGRLADAIKIGAEAITTIDPSRDRAQVADLHSHHQRQAGDQRGALATGLVAFSDRPSLGRLRQVLDDADATRQTAPLAVLASAAGADPLVRLTVQLLAGQIDDVPAVTIAPYPRWTTDNEAVAIGGLLLGSTHHRGRHTNLCTALLGPLDGASTDHNSYLRLRQRPGGTQPQVGPLPLAPRVVLAIASVSPNVERLTVARHRVETSAADVMSNKARGSYGRVAQLVVALAHTSEDVGCGTAASVIADFDREYRRFAAFRKEL